jgi:hypothetical protein
MFPLFCKGELLTNVVQHTMFDIQQYVKLGLACTDVCRVLYRTLKGGRFDELGRPALDAIQDMTTSVRLAMCTPINSPKDPNCRTTIEIQRTLINQSSRNLSSQPSHMGSNKVGFAAWRQDIETWIQDLARVLLVFDVCPIYCVGHLQLSRLLPD